MYKANKACFKTLDFALAGSSKHPQPGFFGPNTSSRKAAKSGRKDQSIPDLSGLPKQLVPPHGEENEILVKYSRPSYQDIRYYYFVPKTEFPERLEKLKPFVNDAKIVRETSKWLYFT